MTKAKTPIQWVGLQNESQIIYFLFLHRRKIDVYAQVSRLGVQKFHSTTIPIKSREWAPTEWSINYQL